MGDGVSRLKRDICMFYRNFKVYYGIFRYLVVVMFFEVCIICGQIFFCLIIYVVLFFDLDVFFGVV